MQKAAPLNSSGNFIQKTPQRRPKGAGPKPMKSSFDEEEQYELTDLGKQFIHYAMTDLPVRISYDPTFSNEEAEN
jgi:hypothetical protein